MLGKASASALLVGPWSRKRNRLVLIMMSWNKGNWHRLSSSKPLVPRPPCVMSCFLHYRKPKHTRCCFCCDFPSGVFKLKPPHVPGLFPVFPGDFWACGHVLCQSRHRFASHHVFVNGFHLQKTLKPEASIPVIPHVETSQKQKISRFSFLRRRREHE